MLDNVPPTLNESWWRCIQFTGVQPNAERMVKWLRSRSSPRLLDLEKIGEP